MNVKVIAKVFVNVKRSKDVKMNVEVNMMVTVKLKW